MLNKHYLLPHCQLLSLMQFSLKLSQGPIYIYILRKEKRGLMCAIIIPRLKVQLGKSKGTISLKMELRDPDPTQAPLVFKPHIKIV